MDATTKWIIGTILFVVVLYYVWKKTLSGSKGSTNPLNSTNGPTTSGSNGGSNVDPRANGTGLAPGHIGSPTRDLAPWLDDPNELDWCIDDWYYNQGPRDPVRDAIWTADWRERFNRQVIRPAQACTAADLEQMHFDLAWSLFDGTLPPPDPANMTDRQRRAKSLADSDEFAAEFYGIYKLLGNILGAFTFGISTIIVNVEDAELGSNGKSLTDTLNDDVKANKLRQGSLSGTDMATLAKWIGPIPIIQARHPSTPLDSKEPFPALKPIDFYVHEEGTTPVYHRYQLFAGGTSGPYLRWNADVFMAGTPNQRANLRARVYRAADIIACQLFPYSTPPITPPGIGPGEPDGFYAYTNPAFGRGIWLKGSVFRPNIGQGDFTYEGLTAFKKAGTTAIVAPLTQAQAIAQAQNQAFTGTLTPDVQAQSLPVTLPIIPPAPPNTPPKIVIPPKGPKGTQIEI